MITTIGDLDRRLREGELRERLLRLGKKYLVTSGKGGAGKTTVASSLALAKASAGLRAGILDIDFHGPNVPGSLFLSGRVLAGDDGRLIPVKHPSGLSVLSLQHLLENPDEAVLWRGPRKMRAIIQFLSDAGWGDLDYFFIDTPPGTGDEALTAARGVPGLKAVVVTTGHSLSLLDAAKAVSSLRSLSVEISGAVDNMGFMRCPDCGRELVFFEESKVREFCEKENIPLLARLPLDPGAMMLSEKLKKPILEAAPDSPLAKALKELADKL